MSHMRKCSSCVKKGQRTANVVSNALKGIQLPQTHFKSKAMDFKTALGTLIGNVSCTSKSCGVPSSIANALHTSVERYYLDFVAYNCKSGYSLNGLRYCKKEFLSGCESDGIYDVPHLTCQSIICFLEDALIAKTIDTSGGFLPNSSPMVLDPNEWLKYQRGEGHTLSLIHLTCSQ